MPELVTVLTEEDLNRRSGAAGGLDLTAYMDIIDAIREQGGVGGTIRLGEDERQRAEKRRLSTAAKQRGMQLVWRKSPEGQLRFVLAEAGGAVPGGRRRNGREPASTGSTAAAEETPMSGRRGRKKATDA